MFAQRSSRNLRRPLALAAAALCLTLTGCSGSRQNSGPVNIGGMRFAPGTTAGMKSPGQVDRSVRDVANGRISLAQGMAQQDRVAVARAIQDVGPIGRR